MNNVWLLWDITPNTKGEKSELVAVYVSPEAAERAVKRLVDSGDYEPEDLNLDKEDVTE